MVIIDCSVIKVYLNTELCSGHHDIVGADTLLKNIARPALHFTQCNLKYQFLHCVLLRKINSAMARRLNSTFVSTLFSALLSALVTDLNFILVTRPTDPQKWSAALPNSIVWRIVHYFQECLNHHFPLWSQLRMRVNGYQIPPGSIIAQEYNMYRVNGYQIPAQRKVNNCPSRRPSRLKILSVYRMGTGARQVKVSGQKANYKICRPSF